MEPNEEQILEDGRIATLTRDQTWTTFTDKRHVAGVLLVVEDKRTGDQTEAAIYIEGGERRVGILKQRVVWEGTANPAVGATSFTQIEMADARSGLAEELLAIYRRFSR